ncbi:MAG TPA: hypothetical protein VIB48_12795 [Acidimicrobiia bacterium]|jgi:hypothetical protein
MVFALGAAVGAAIWIPAEALQPRHATGPHQGGQPLWYFPAMVGAATVLAAICASEWRMVAAGLIAAPLVLAGPTTPRGDNDGLWLFIFPLLVVLGVGLYALCAVIAHLSLRIRDRIVPRLK